MAPELDDDWREERRFAFLFFAGTFLGHAAQFEKDQGVCAEQAALRTRVQPDMFTHVTEVADAVARARGRGAASHVTA